MGARPPEQSPQQWLDHLGELPLSVNENTVAIYTGTVNGIDNLVFELTPNGELRIASNGSLQYWSFDTSSGEFIVNRVTSGNWPQQIIDGSGRNYTPGSAKYFSEMTRQMVSYKLSPTT